MIQKHITIGEEHEKILDHLILNIQGVQNYSEAIRYLCMNYEPESKKLKETKINAMSKEISILLTILTSSLAESVDVGEISNYRELDLYKKAKNIVDENIQKNVTRSQNKKKIKVVRNDSSKKDSEIEEKKTIF